MDISFIPRRQTRLPRTRYRRAGMYLVATMPHGFAALDSAAATVDRWVTLPSYYRVHITTAHTPCAKDLGTAGRRAARYTPYYLPATYTFSAPHVAAFTATIL